jgi:nucleotide-binding universal stress UspA family protein
VSVETIIVGYDGSAPSDAALDAATDLALRLRAHLVVAYAAAPPHRSVGEEFAEYRLALEEIGTNATTAALARAAAAGADAEAVLVDEDPVSGLIDLAAVRSASMIVVGATGERPIVGALLGSNTLKLAQRSPIPVLVVPVPAA